MTPWLLLSLVVILADQLTKVLVVRRLLMALVLTNMEWSRVNCWVSSPSLESELTFWDVLKSSSSELLELSPDKISSTSCKST